MSNAARYRLVGKLGVLVLLSISLWKFSGSAAIPQEKDRVVPINVKQLRNDSGPIPVELVCGTVRSSAPNILDSFTCTLKNNTEKRISAANAIYSVVIEREGIEESESYDSTIDSIFHQDFASTAKLVNPGEESASVGPPGAISYPENVIIKRIDIHLDFVEFEDGTSLGRNSNGSKIINDMRDGAERYKRWLANTYFTRGRSYAVLTTLLNEENLPNELQLLNEDQNAGARAYRNRLRKMNIKVGGLEVEKLLQAKKD